MSTLTFSVFWKWFADDFSPTKTESEHFIFGKLFWDYFVGPDGHEIGESMLNRIKKGEEKLPKKLINAYCASSQYTDALENAVKKYIMPNVRNWPAAGEALCAIIDNDPTIPEARYQELKAYCNLEGKDETVTWLTKVLLCAMDPRELPEVAKKLRMVSITYTPRHCDWFEGRGEEIGEIHKKLRKYKKVFIHGIPGIGKSELAKKYVTEYGKEYAEVLWIPCRDSLRKSIASVELERDRMEDDDQTRFRNHLHMLKHLPQGALAVLDNCNWLPEDEPLLDEIMECRCHILVTTRTVVEDRCNLEVQELPEQDLVEMMKHFCKKKNYPDRDLELLIRKLHKHTFAVELAARIVKGKLTPRELLVNLKLSRFARNVFKKNVASHKDNATKKASYYQTMSDLFMLLNLDPDKQDLLRNMTLMPDEGVYLDNLLMLLCMRDEETVEDLAQMGLLRWDDDSEIVQLLPMVREIAMEDVHPSVRRCNVLVDRVAQLLSEYGADDHCLPLLYAIMKRIVDEAEKDDPKRYWTLLCNAFNAMEGIGQRNAMNRILSAMEVFVQEHPLTNLQTAEYLDMKACLMEDKKEKVLLEEKALHILEESGAGNSELARNICNNLAGAYRETYQYQKAIAFLEKRLVQIKEEERNPLRYNYMTCVCNLAMAYAETGEYMKALDLLKPTEQALQKLEKQGTEYAWVLETLGHIHMLSGQLPVAIKQYEKALSIWNDLHGWQSPVVQEKATEYRELIQRAAMISGIAGSIG